MDVRSSFNFPYKTSVQKHLEIKQESMVDLCFTEARTVL